MRESERATALGDTWSLARPPNANALIFEAYERVHGITNATTTTRVNGLSRRLAIADGSPAKTESDAFSTANSNDSVLRLHLRARPNPSPNAQTRSRVNSSARRLHSGTHGTVVVHPAFRTRSSRRRDWYNSVRLRLLRWRGRPRRLPLRFAAVLRRRVQVLPFELRRARVRPAELAAPRCRRSRRRPTMLGRRRGRAVYRRCAASSNASPPPRERRHRNVQPR